MRHIPQEGLYIDYASDHGDIDTIYRDGKQIGTVRYDWKTRRFSARNNWGLFLGVHEYKSDAIDAVTNYKPACPTMAD